eukprot:g2390.t1
MEDVDALFSELGIEVPVASDGTFVFDEEPALKSEDVADCAGEEAEKIEEKKPNATEEKTTGTSSGCELLRAPVSIMSMQADESQSAGGSKYFNADGSVRERKWKAPPSASRAKAVKEAAAAAEREQQRREKKKAKERKRREKEIKEEQERRTKKVMASVTYQSRYNPVGDLASASDALACRVEGLCLGFGGTGAGELLRDSDLKLVAGHRYGLIGKNGVGKSTLLGALPSLAPQKARLMLVAQEVEGDDTIVLSSVIDSDKQAVDLRRQISMLEAKMDKDDATDDTRLANLYNELDALGAATSEARAASILSGLGFSDAMQRAATKTLSGGWRMRLALAQALFLQPDLLVLDEPTNHLDLLAVLWLQQYLRKWSSRSTLLVVSHDRAFLNGIATDIILMEQKKLHYYSGDYDRFRAQEEIKHMQAFVDKWLHNRFGNNRGQVQARLKQIHKYKTPGYKEFVPKPLPLSKGTLFKFRAPEKKLNGSIVELKDVSFAYPSSSRDIFRSLNMKITMKSHIAIIGANGAGKSTLLKLAAGAVRPNVGAVVCKSKVRIALFTQHFADQLDLTLKPLESMRNVLGPLPSVQELRRRLGAFGIGPETAELPIAKLSGAVAHDPHIIFLDEPTNHLDIESIEGLGNAIRAFEGAVVLVSHDERLLHSSCNELWVCDGNGSATQLHISFSEYRDKVMRNMGGNAVDSSRV